MSGTAILSTEEVGAYILLLSQQWNLGGLPNDDVILRRLSRTSETFNLDLIRTKFETGSDGKLRNKRLEEVRKRQNDYSKSRSENGLNGGRPRKPHGKHMESTAKAHLKHRESSPTPTPTPTPNSDLQSPPVVKGGGKRSKLPDAEWIASLKSNPAYSGIDIDRELGRMQIWASENGRTPSRRRLLNWLNRSEAPLSTNGHLVEKPLSLFEMKTITQAKQLKMDDLKARFSSEAALGLQWSDGLKKAEWQGLRREIKDLNDKIASYAR